MATSNDAKTIVWDFGFVDETEIGGVIEALEKTKAAEGTVEELQNRLDRLYTAYQPLLENLKREPHKDYVLFPNRGPKIEAFESMLANIYYGKS